MWNIYADSFMIATRTRRCTRVELPKTRWWHLTRTKCIELDRL
jgi:hypothetical protein